MKRRDHSFVRYSDSGAKVARCLRCWVMTTRRVPEDQRRAPQEPNDLRPSLHANGFPPFPCLLVYPPSPRPLWFLQFPPSASCLLQAHFLAFRLSRSCPSHRACLRRTAHRLEVCLIHPSPVYGRGLLPPLSSSLPLFFSCDVCE